MIRYCRIISSFTADPIAQPLNYFIKLFGYGIQISIDPYGQLIQSLLSIKQHDLDKKNNINLILVRNSDFYSVGNKKDVDILNKNILEFSLMLKQITETSSSQNFLFICPEKSTDTSLQNILAEKCSSIDRLNIITPNDLSNKGSDHLFFDHISDELACIPYTQHGFTVLAKAFMQKFYAIYRKPYKVIITDCDNTLWSGVCSEIGAENIKLKDNHYFLQNFLKDQVQNGMLLCLCSKNVESDVLAVLEHNKNMPLNMEIITAYRINWKSKSENIKELSDLLELSLDSFIFIDDNPVECAEIQQNLPQVLTIQLPTEKNWPNILNNVWAFDGGEVTLTDINRSSLYKDQIARKFSEQKYTTLIEFINTLNIKVHIEEAKADTATRISQLSFRINQFNFNDNKFTKIDALNMIADDSCKVSTVRVADRFGNYGIVGLLLFTISPKKLILRNLALSCRVLGKGIEHTVIKYIAKIAISNNCNEVVIEFCTTTRNLPAIDFINSLPASKKGTQELTCNSSNLAQIKFTAPTRKTSSLSNINYSANHSKRMVENNAQIIISKDSYDIKKLEEKIYGLKVISTFDKNFTSAERKIANLLAPLVMTKNIDQFSDFFTYYGINSLVAVQIASGLHKEFSLKISLLDIYQNSSINKMAKLIKKMTLESKTVLPVINDKYTYNTPYPLYFSQENIWFIEQIEPNKALYNENCAVNLNGEINKNALSYAFKTLVKQHSSFRTRFINFEGEAKQIICKQADITIKFINTSTYTKKETEDLISSEITTPFNLEKPPLLRVFLLSKNTKEHILLIVSHHIIVDGWSWGIINNEISSSYTDFIDNAPKKEKDVNFDFNQVIFSEEQKYMFQHNFWEDQDCFWKKYLKSFKSISLSELSITKTTEHKNTEHIMLTINAKKTALLHKVASANSVTLFSTLFSALSISISSLTNQDDIALGSVSNGRENSEVQNIIGMFVNTLIIRVILDKNVTLPEYLYYVNHQILLAIKNQNLPYSTIIKKYVPREITPPIKIMLVLQNSKNLVMFPNITAEKYRANIDVALFDILVNFEEIDGALEGSICYKPSLYKRETIQEILTKFNKFIDAISSGDNTAILNLL